MADQVYLDWNATAPLRPQARAAMVSALDAGGNPSSVHAAGRQARRRVEVAREQVAALVGSKPADVVFTSGGTEANALALSPALGDVLLLSAIEHPAVLCGGRFPAERVRTIPVTPTGVIDLNALEILLAQHPHALVSIMLANNETGIIQPIALAADMSHKAGGMLHVDAVQGPGRLDININELQTDLLSISSHKLGGPQGAGALIRRGDVLPDPLIRGGGQERGLRAGTENVPAISGFGAAADAVGHGLTHEAAHMLVHRDRLEAGLRRITPDVVVFGADSPRLPNTTLFALPGVKAETVVIAFDLEGVAVSSGSACSSGKVATSHVLAAMGVDPMVARGAIRLSLGPTTSEQDIDFALSAWEKLSKTLYKSMKQDDIAA